MTKNTFYLKALGLIVIGSVAKAAVYSLQKAISAPTTVNNYNTEVKAESPGQTDDGQLGSVD